MATGQEKFNVSCTHVFELPYAIRKPLTVLLDLNSTWEILAAKMGYTATEVLQFRKAALSNQNFSDVLLTVWGSRGHKVEQLLKLLVKIDQTSAVNLLLPTGGCSVDPLIAISMHNTLRINYEDLRLATGQFSPENIIGQGGYGVVYRGHWKHTSVAVKRLGVTKLASGQVVKKQSSTVDNEGFRQSMAELKTLALCRHDNILPLYGYCFDGAECCVVYQFMIGGSLDDRLFSKGKSATNCEPLNWRQRLKIARGAACGLSYLHTCSKEPLIHGDIKPANILLDSCSEPKLGDFGLCRRGLVESGDSPLIASHIKGTLAYLPPEFIRSRILTTKLDVYSFGMVFFELATALRAYSDFRKPSNLAEFMREEKNRAIDKIGLTALADAKLQNSCENWEEAFHTLIELGYRCTECDREKRPIICDVINLLDEKIADLLV